MSGSVRSSLLPRPKSRFGAQAQSGAQSGQADWQRRRRTLDQEISSASRTPWGSYGVRDSAPADGGLPAIAADKLTSSSPAKKSRKDQQILRRFFFYERSAMRGTTRGKKEEERGPPA